MGDYEVQLPLKVERMIGKICFDQCQPPPDTAARKILASIGEESSLHMLKLISQSKIKTFTGFIKYLAKDYKPVTCGPNSSESDSSIFLSPQKRQDSVSSSSGTDDFIFHSPFPTYLVHSPSSSVEKTSTPVETSGLPSSRLDKTHMPIATHGSPSSSVQRTYTPVATHSLASTCSNLGGLSSLTKKSLVFPQETVPNRESSYTISKQWLILFEIEFRKIFLLLNYIGRKKMEDVISVEDAYKIVEMKDYPMERFELKVWSMYGHFCVVGNESSDRRKYLDWESGKTHYYQCHVWQDGSYSFKGPYLRATKTLLHKILGDENVLIVKFEEQARGGSINFSGNHIDLYRKIAKQGILIGQRRYRYFVFKEGDRKGKKKIPITSNVNCYFIRMELIAPCDEKEVYILSNKTMHQARCLFMHLHTTPSMAKYVARCSLLLSQTINVAVNLDSVYIERIEDIPCRNAKGISVCNEDGDLLIHTDGTGYISEDLAMRCPGALLSTRYMMDKKSELEDESLEGKLTDALVREPPLLMQCRLFYNGCAVKGTFLINKKLLPGTIQIRPSMVKVEADPTLKGELTVNSLEVVNISRKPARSRLSKNLIALLNFGGVPEQFFLDILRTALEDSRKFFSDKRSAVKVSLNRSSQDDDSTTARMILSGVPLEEPCLQYRLSLLALSERKALRQGKLPISESFFLMGTADPTGLLKSDEVCVILENGQLSGKVLVYRYPGLHFGDIHVLNAVYLKELEDVVGNAKYGIFFSTNGQRSVASEIANGDFDGDLYWVSRNDQLLKFFKESKPWAHMQSSPNVIHRRPSDFSNDQLEHELFELFLNTKNQNIAMGVAADSWLAFADELLVLGDDDSDKKSQLRAMMLKLIDIYYDALDAPKTGKKVIVPNDLKAHRYPHYMEKTNWYPSHSVLGKICEAVEQFKTENLSTYEIKKLPLFEQVQIPEALLKYWKEEYDIYRQDMTDAKSSDDQSETSCADEVISRYKQILYGAADFRGTSKNINDIYVNALALYHVCYDFAKSKGDVRKCNFVWKVAGPALCNYHELKSDCLPSVLRELLK